MEGSDRVRSSEVSMTNGALPEPVVLTCAVDRGLAAQRGRLEIEKRDREGSIIIMRVDEREES